MQKRICVTKTLFLLLNNVKKCATLTKLYNVPVGETGANPVRARRREVRNIHKSYQMPQFGNTPLD